MTDTELTESKFVDSIFIWDDETHLTIRNNLEKVPGYNLEGAKSALGVTISYPRNQPDDVKETLRVGRATTEYRLAASDITASVFLDRKALRPKRFEIPAFKCEIIFEASHAGRFEKIGLILQSGPRALDRLPEVKVVEIDFAWFSIGKLANGAYRKAALTYAFFEDLPLSHQQTWWAHFGDEQSIIDLQTSNLTSRSSSEDWPKILAGDALRFRYVFDTSGESISYVMPLDSVRGELKQFTECVASL